MSEFFTKDDCIPDSKTHNYKDQVLVVAHTTLSPQFQKKELQLWKATGGFGCDPKKLGKAVFATSLADGESIRWERYEFIGIVKPDVLDQFKAENPGLLTWDHDPELPDQVPQQT